MAMEGLMAGLINTIPSLFQMREGRRQLKLAKQLADRERPLYNKPQSFLEAVGIQRELAAPNPLMGLGYMESQAETGIARGTRGLQELSSSPSEMLAVASNLYSTQQEQLGEIATQNAQFMQNQKISQAMSLINMLMQEGNLEDKMFQINEFAPYAEAMNAAAALEGAGRQNIGRSISGLTSAVTGGLSNAAMMNLAGENAPSKVNVDVNDVVTSILGNTGNKRVGQSKGNLLGNELVSGSVQMPVSLNGGGNGINTDMLFRLLLGQ